MNLIYHSSHTSPVRVTVLAKIEGNAVRFGVSRCSRHDQFVKKTGRLIAEGRADRNPYREVKLPIVEPISEWFIRNAQEIEEEVIPNPERINRRPVSFAQRVRQYLTDMIGV
jgi:hypothetical protein